MTESGTPRFPVESGKFAFDEKQIIVDHINNMHEAYNLCYSFYMISNNPGVTIQDFLQTYQAANSQFDTLLNMMGIFIAVFSTITAIIIAFFTIKQINVDREIRKYRDEIKNQKELAIQEVKNIKKELEDTQKWTNETKNKIDNELKKPPSKQTKKELEKIQKSIEDLREKIAFKQGELSSSPTLNAIMQPRAISLNNPLDAFLHNDSTYDNATVVPKYCHNCGSMLPSDINLLKSRFCIKCGAIN